MGYESFMKTWDEVRKLTWWDGSCCCIQDIKLGGFVIFTHSPYEMDDDLNIGQIQEVVDDSVFINAADGTLLLFTKGREWEVTGENYKWSWAVYF